MLGPKDKRRTRGYWWRKQLFFEIYWVLIPNGERILGFLLTMLAPEGYAYYAVRQNLSANACKIEFEALRPNCHPPHGWSLAHTYFAGMGGFVVHSNIATSSPVVTRLSAKSLLRLLQHDDYHQRIDCGLFPSEEELHDRSKSNAVTKGVVVLQIVWFVANCITRLARRLPTTQLEMSIFGTAVCSLVSYVTHFEKPHAVKTAIAVLSFDGDIPSQIADVIQETDTHSSPNASDSLRFDEALAFVVCALLATVLGAFHVAAWDFFFPTEIDRMMWRVSSVITCALPLGLWIVLFLFGFVALLVEGVLSVLRINWDAERDMFMKALVALVFLLYSIPRMILAVLMIRFLFYIPPGAFKTGWADNIPHI
jgi:hypothetical protein